MLISLKRNLRRYDIDELKIINIVQVFLFAANGDKYMVKNSAEEIDNMLLNDPNVTLDKTVEKYWRSLLQRRWTYCKCRKELNSVL